MTRREIIAEGVELYLGDCRDILPTLGGIDAVVTDPPYGIAYKPGGGGKFSGEGGQVKKRHWGEVAIVGDNAQFDPTFLLEYPARHRILWGANNYANALPNRQGWLFWDKHRAESNLSFAEGEFAWTDLPRTARAFRHLWNGVCKDSESGATREHPTQKPIALFDWCLGLLPQGTASIVDPFMGSGTSGVSAVKAGLRFTGIEIEPKYFDIACRRIDAAARQGTLFPPTPALSSEELRGDRE